MLSCQKIKEDKQSEDEKKSTVYTLVNELIEELYPNRPRANHFKTKAQRTID